MVIIGIIRRLVIIRITTVIVVTIVIEAILAIVVIVVRVARVVIVRGPGDLPLVAVVVSPLDAKSPA